MSNTNIFKTSDHGILDATIEVPTPDQIGNKAIRKAVEALIEAADRRNRNADETRAGEARVAEAKKADFFRVDGAVMRGEEVPADIHELENAAKADLERVTVQRPTLDRLYAEAYFTLESAVEENGLEWASASARVLDQAVNDLVSIRRQLETVSATLGAHFGVVTLALQGADHKPSGRQVFSSADNGASIPLNSAVAAVTDSMQKVHERVNVSRDANRADVEAQKAAL